MKFKHRNTKFIFDFETSDSFSLLDVKITRTANGSTTSVFRKAMFNGVFTNFDSFTFHKYRIGLIDALLFRWFTICSGVQTFRIEG